jgi:predicted  nucleic acid-binding Zn-ribbon protein
VSDPSLQLHPEHRALLEENALLREELAHLLTEEHDLVRLVKPNLLALYQKKIGAWELRGLQAQVAAMRARRRLEMAQAAVNQSRKPDLMEIDGLLELELLAWQQKIQEAAARIASAEQRLNHLLPDVEDRELKKLYYSLVKKLHPDVNPDLSEDQSRLWLRVQAAYEHSDVQELRALALLADRPGFLPFTPPSLDILRKDRATLDAQITAILKRIEQLENQPPFTLRHQLEDEAWLTERREEIETRIAQLEAQGSALEIQLKTLLPSIDDGKVFGSN